MASQINQYRTIKNDEVIRLFIDYRNQSWFNKIINDKGFTFRVFEDSTKKTGDDWRFTPANNHVSILFPLGDNNKNIFTHELLHTFIYINGFYSIKRFYFLQRKEENFRKAWMQVEGGFFNSIQHLKMFPMYCKAEYEPKQFRTDITKDYEVDKKLKILKDNVPYEQFFRNYIELFYTVIDPPSEEKKESYESVIVELKEIEIDLFNILNSTIDSWLNKSGFYFDELYEMLINKLEYLFVTNSNLR